MTLNDNNHDASQTIISLSTKRNEQDVSLKSSINHHHCTAAKLSKHSKSLLKRHRRMSQRKSNAHSFGQWTIHESLEPFPEKNNLSKPKKQEQGTALMGSNVREWNIDQVCSFVESTLGMNCYTPIFKEHLIDGMALLLLGEEHLRNILKMPSTSRVKLLDGISRLKSGDVMNF